MQDLHLDMYLCMGCVFRLGSLLWYRKILQVDTDISEEYAPPIFRDEVWRARDQFGYSHDATKILTETHGRERKQPPSASPQLLFLLTWGEWNIEKLLAACPFEMLLSTYKTAYCHKEEHHNLSSHLFKNFTTYNTI
jgi:hypothetical protein